MRARRWARFALACATEERHAHGQVADSCACAVIVRAVPYHPRDYDALLLECPAPPEAAKYFVFMFQGRALHSVKLDELVYKEDPSRIGWCLGGLYSELPYFSSWISDALSAGADDVWVYHSRLTADSSAAMANFQGSSHAHQNVSAMVPFEPLPHSHVQYIETIPARGQWDTLSKAVYYTLCVHKARYSHRYVIVTVSIHSESQA